MPSDSNVGTSFYLFLEKKVYILRNQLNRAAMYFPGWRSFESHSRTKSRFHEKANLILSTDNTEGS